MTIIQKRNHHKHTARKGQAVARGTSVAARRQTISSHRWTRLLKMRKSLNLAREEWLAAFDALERHQLHAKRLAELLGGQMGVAAVEELSHILTFDLSISQQDLIRELEYQVENEENAICEALWAGAEIENGGRIEGGNERGHE